MKIAPLTTILLIIGSLMSLQLLAQPEHKHHKGCHYSWNAQKMKPLSDQQKADLQVSAERSDTIDILNYNITLEIIDFGAKKIKGNTEVTFTPILDNTSRIELNLLSFTVDSVHLNGSNVPFVNDGLFVTVEFPNNLNIGDTSSVQIWYEGSPTVSPGGFGGLDFRDGIAYNLGIGLGSDPYNYGRGWYPCFDNFVERATYDFNIISKLPKKAYCSGVFMGETPIGGDTLMRSFSMQYQLPSYLAGVAVGDFAEHNDIHDGLERDIPIQLVAAPGNIEAMKNSFVDLGGVIDALEFWFGPYAWNRVGYVTTQVGAMEHSDNIAYPTFSAIEGNTFSNRRLMAHELAHHWWGNVAGIPGAADMWFKEGNAEYSAHLITEYLFGNEAFVDQVKDNHLDVIANAHIDDGDFLPLSGIPYENTYGTHTYNKGASMMHNLRGYMGDDNFRAGMTSVQENLGFTSITADDFRDHLTSVTGVPLVNFFNDWLKSPGWSGFNIEKIDSEINGGAFDVQVEILQGLRGATNLHTEVPMVITFHGENGAIEEKTISISGQLSLHDFSLPFDPTFAVINEGHELNIANTLAIVSRDDAGNYGTANTGITMSTSIQSEPMEIFVDQKWFGPLPSTNPDVKFATKRFWDIRGNFAENHDLEGVIQYRGNSDNSFEIDLVSETEDSLIVAYRADANEEWVEYPDYIKNFLGSPSDGFGILIVKNMRPGQYCLANGTLELSNVKDIPSIQSNIFPNPANSSTKLETESIDPGSYFIKVYGLNGDEKIVESLEHMGGILSKELELSNLSNGTYWISLERRNGQVLLNESINVIR